MDTELCAFKKFGPFALNAAGACQTRNELRLDARPPSSHPSVARFRFEDTRRGPLSLMDQGASKCKLGVHSLPAYLTVLIHVWLEKLDSDHIQMAPSGLPQ